MEPITSSVKSLIWRQTLHLVLNRQAHPLWNWVLRQISEPVGDVGVRQISRQVEDLIEESMTTVQTEV